MWWSGSRSLINRGSRVREMRSCVWLWSCARPDDFINSMRKFLEGVLDCDEDEKKTAGCVLRGEASGDVVVTRAAGICRFKQGLESESMVLLDCVKKRKRGDREVYIIYYSYHILR